MAWPRSASASVKASRCAWSGELLSAAPPLGPPWDLPLDEAPLTFVDLEMTGLDPAKDRVVEICVERVIGGAVVERLHSLVRPDGGEIGNVHVHGIDAAALAEAPTFPELLDRVLSIFEGSVLVAHGASWDVSFLEAETRRAGRPLLIPFYIDTLNLSRRTLGVAKHSLSALRGHFGIDAARAHRADADVHALREVWSRCIKELEPRTARDVWEVRIAERHARAQILEECRSALTGGAAVTLAYRPRSRPAQSIRMVITAIDESTEPPRILGYELPGRGRRDLRSDRILRVDK